jgi:16S rRNA (cytosine1402-N4)-methyltransferase
MSQTEEAMPLSARETAARVPEGLEGRVTDFHHISVLLDEVVEALDPTRGGVFLDGTLGGAGHSLAILEAARVAGVRFRLLGVDRDPEAIEAASARLSAFGDSVKVVNGNYGDLPSIIHAEGVKGLDGLLIDAGVSSHQLDKGRRGFSFSKGGPLDMRMGPDARTAGEVIDQCSRQELTNILKSFGEVRGAWGHAGAIMEAREAGELTETTQLAELIERRTRGWKRGVHPATLVFQALRIAANDELASLEKVVWQLPELLNMGGRAAFISFHSLEDRIVKHCLRALTAPCTCPPGLPVCACGKVAKIRTVGKLVRPSESELRENPRARSARLRVAERVA